MACVSVVCVEWTFVQKSSYIKLCAGIADEAIVCDGIDEGQAVPHTTVVVIEVVGWSDLHSTCTTQQGEGRK